MKKNTTINWAREDEDQRTFEDGKTSKFYFQQYQNTDKAYLVLILIGLILSVL